MSSSILIKGGELITLAPSWAGQDQVIKGDILIEDGRIAAIAPSIRSASWMETIDARGRYVLPGFVQSHVHLCQTLFRGAADDLSLIEWLKERIWPLEAGLTRESLAISARLGIAEMIRSGTTAALTMESVNHTDSVFEEALESGFRATIGKCMMDRGEDIPAALLEKTEDSIKEAEQLLKRWHGRANGRLRYGFAPRFALSCSRELLAETARLARHYGVRLHTHAAENSTEIAMVSQMTGQRNVEYLREVGIVGPDVILAHCIHLDQLEREILRSTGTHVAHCPSSNLKLGSGIAPVVELLQSGVNVSLGADGAACNNRLDMFTEMRTASLLQKPLHGPQAVPAFRALQMATIDGARALGLENQIGSLEVGKCADLQLLNLESIQTSPHPDPVTTIVYAADSRNVETVLIDGRLVMRDQKLTTIDEPALIRSVNSLFSII